MRKVFEFACAVLLPVVLLSGCALVETIPLLGDIAADDGSTELELSVSAADDVNPDEKGVPSPIEIRFYQLQSSAEFESGDFFSIYNNEALTDSLIKEKIFILSPSEEKQVVLELDDGAQYVAVLAAFQDIDNAEWSDLMIVRDSRGILKKLFTSSKVVSLSVNVEDKSVQLSEHRGYGADWL